MIQETVNGQRLTGIYLGQVIQHCTHGYCKIYIPSVYPEEYIVNPDLLPVAAQATSLFGGINNGSGVFTYPNISSIVYCFFANGDQNLPVYFASSLGGHNAFGQYEIIKTPDEDVSNKHMVTSGKTHIKWFESGKLSVQVEDPDRRDAVVQCSSYMSQYHDDSVSARPSCDLIDNRELSNLHCNVVFDNSSHYGFINHQTYHFEPSNISRNEILSDAITQQITANVIETKNGTEEFEQNDYMDNAMNRRYSAISTYNITYSKNLTNNVTEETEQIAQKFKINESNIQKFDVNNNYVLEVKHNNDIVDTYNKYNNLTKETTSKNLKAKSTFNGIMSITDSNKLVFSMLSDCTIINATDSSIAALTSTVNNVFELNDSKGLNLNLTVNQKDMPTAGTTIIRKNSDIETRDNSDTAEFSHIIKSNKTTITSGSSTKNADSQFVNTISTNKAKLVEDFVDNMTKNQCTKTIDLKNGYLNVIITKPGKKSVIRMDSDGNILIDSSTTIKIHSPDISIKGDTKIDMTAPTINIKANSGDCMIKNVSLLKHVHTEMQSGDIVIGGVIKTMNATASN